MESSKPKAASNTSKSLAAASALDEARSAAHAAPSAGAPLAHECTKYIGAAAYTKSAATAKQRRVLREKKGK